LPADHRQRLATFFQQHNPDKLGTVDGILAKYAGRETQLFINLATKYNAAVPPLGLSSSLAQPVAATAAGGAVAFGSPAAAAAGLDTRQAIPNLRMRVAKLEDVPALRLLEQRFIEAQRSFDPAIDADQPFFDLEQLIKSKQARVMIMETQQGYCDRNWKSRDPATKIVATGSLSIKASEGYKAHSRHAYLGFMYVDPELRGRGINKLVTDALVEWGRVKGCNHAYLDVHSSNASAVRAVEKSGFGPWQARGPGPRPSFLAPPSPLTTTMVVTGKAGRIAHALKEF
jgi:ribosomal protein S18 acetylase RimI-like enzyme